MVWVLSPLIFYFGFLGHDPGTRDGRSRRWGTVPGTRRPSCAVPGRRGLRATACVLAPSLTLAGKVLFQICGMFAEFERNLILERTKAGLAATRARGRKPKMTPEQFDRAASLIRTFLEQSGRESRAKRTQGGSRPSICPTTRKAADCRGPKGCNSPAARTRGPATGRPVQNERTLDSLPSLSDEYRALVSLHRACLWMVHAGFGCSIAVRTESQHRHRHLHPVPGRWACGRPVWQPGC